MNVAIVAIVKDEGPYLAEWIRHHRSLGISHFFLADNESTDATKTILSFYRLQGYLSCFAFPSEPTEMAPQLPAYEMLIRKAQLGYDWILVIDADEFVIFEDPQMDLLRFLDTVGRKETVGSVAINWLCFGSSHRLAPGYGLVLERFTGHHPVVSAVNRHYKSLVRSKAFASVGDNPHYFRLHEGFLPVDELGRPLKNDPHLGLGISSIRSASIVRLNHYVIKSRSEFMSRKARRSLATGGSTDWGAYFLRHDQNQELTEVDPAWTSELRTLLEGDFLQAKQGGFPLVREDFLGGSDPVLGEGQLKILSEPRGVHFERGLGQRGGSSLLSAMDEVTLRNSGNGSPPMVQIRGWVVAPGEAEVAAYIDLGQQKVLVELDRPRPDVALHLARQNGSTMASHNCGFDLTLPAFSAFDFCVRVGMQYMVLWRYCCY